MKITSAALAVGIALAVTTASREGCAQTLRGEVDEEHDEYRRGGELGAFVLAAGSYGLRLGSMINWWAGRRPDDGDFATYAILPSTLAVVGVTGALLADHYHPLRRGRALALGAGTVVGYLGSLSLTMWLRNEATPSVETIAGPTTFVGTTAGLVAGVLVGHLTDARPGEGLYVATGTVGGTLLGVFLCGALRCGTDLGAWAFAGEMVGLGATLATRALLRPTAREMRLVAVGAIGGALPAVSVITAHWARDGGITNDAWARASGLAVGGILIGGVAGYAIARSTAVDARPPVPLAVLPMTGSALGLSVAGSF